MDAMTDGRGAGRLSRCHAEKRDGFAARRGVAKRLVALALFCLVSVQTMSIPAEASNQNAYRSASIVSVALGELGYKERENSNYSKYGEWYGCSDVYWCDMFVSWCANEAGYPKSLFPRDKSCTSHMRAFERMGAYHPSRSRGGNYIPLQGDLIFFYDANKYPKGNVLLHVGIVLFVEGDTVCTIEGNTRTTRRDYDYCSELAALRENEPKSITDCVSIKQYELGERCIHGYAAPAYGDRSVLELDSYVDMAEFRNDMSAVERLVDAGVMGKTSAYTFSPKYGMTRGEFVESLMALYELSGCEDGVLPFDDAPETASCYDALLTARSIGVIDAAEGNLFDLGHYISSMDAQEIITKTLAYLDRPNRTFPFPDGDMSYLLTQYTNRIDIARAFFELLTDMETPSESPAAITVDGELVSCPAMILNDANYVALTEARQYISDGFGGAQESAAALDALAEQINAAAQEQSGVRPDAARVFVRTMKVLVSGEEKSVDYFLRGGVGYVKIRDFVSVNGFDISWDANTNTVCIERAYVEQDNGSLA